MNVINWDFNVAEGDTIREKYWNLLNLIEIQNAQNKIRFAVGSREILSIIETMDEDFRSATTVHTTGHLNYIGNYGNRKDKTNIELFFSPSVEKNELVLFGEKNTVIKILNYI